MPLSTLDYVMKRMLDDATLAYLLWAKVMSSIWGTTRKAVESNWSDMRTLGRLFDNTPCCVAH